MENKKMLTTKEVSQLAGVNLDTVRRWDKKGLIKSYRTDGGHRRYDADSVKLISVNQRLLGKINTV